MKMYTFFPKTGYSSRKYDVKTHRALEHPESHPREALQPHYWQPRTFRKHTGAMNKTPIKVVASRTSWDEEGAIGQMTISQ